MPHLIVEYSANLRDKLNPQEFVDQVHEATVATGEFPPMSLRSRAVERTCYRVGDGRPENAFVHVTLRIRPGRDPELKQRLGEAVFAAVCAFLEPTFACTPLGLTFEVQEIEVRFRFLKNNMPEYWGVRDAQAAAGKTVL